MSKDKTQRECSYCGRTFTECGLGCYEKLNDRHFCSMYHARFFYMSEQAEVLKVISNDLNQLVFRLSNQ